LHDLLKSEGVLWNRKRTYRLYREESLQVRTKQRKKLHLLRVIARDNGPEFTGKALFLWAQQHRANLHFIQPDEATQNAFVEWFNGKFRDQSSA
jgi:putative transposase